MTKKIIEVSNEQLNRIVMISFYYGIILTFSVFIIGIKPPTETDNIRLLAAAIFALLYLTFGPKILEKAINRIINAKEKGG